LQIQHFIISAQQTLDKPGVILSQSDKRSKLRSKRYHGLIEAFHDDTKECEKDLVEAIDDDWIQICENASSGSYHLRMKLQQLKTIQ
jgi:hypothetical protein